MKRRAFLSGLTAAIAAIALPTSAPAPAAKSEPDIDRLIRDDFVRRLCLVEDLRMLRSMP